MPTGEVRSIPVQFEMPLRGYMKAHKKYLEMRSRPGVDVRALDDAWRKSQIEALQIEQKLIRQYGQAIAEEMLLETIGVPVLPRV